MVDLNFSIYTQMTVLVYWYQFQPFDWYVHLIVGLAFLFIGAIGIAANLIVIVFCVKYEKTNQVSTYSTINLSISNLLTLLINVPVS